MKIEKIKNKCLLGLQKEIKKDPKNAKKCLKFLNKLLKAITEVQMFIQAELEEVLNYED